jgi:hypothetical protein
MAALASIPVRRPDPDVLGSGRALPPGRSAIRDRPGAARERDVGLQEQSFVLATLPIRPPPRIAAVVSPYSGGGTVVASPEANRP